MRKAMKRWISLAFVLAFSVMCVMPAFAQDTSSIATPILEVQNVDITSGSVYDLSTHQSATTVLGLSEGTIFVEFQSTSTAQYQSLFSVSNPTTGNQYRHFHLYITPDGILGMELRNNDSDFKYTMASPEILRIGRVNRVAFKADNETGCYKLFANGRLVTELNQSAFKFFKDILGAASISLGGTIRQGSVAYPFGGTITKASVYSEALSDTEIQEMTELAPELLIHASESIPITAGSYYDLSSQANAGAVQDLNQGTIIVSYATTSTEEIQSLFSVGNSTSGNKDRHFHIYITSTGALGMELRNTDISFKYTLSRPAAVDGMDHGQPAVNTVAFKADPLDGTYKLFINGDLLATLNENNWKFIRDISGVNNIALGATLRNGEVD